MTQKRKRLSGPEKIAIVKRYLVERMPISGLCDEYGLQPSQIYRWQAAIVAQKDATLAQKNEIISELMEENILTKKPVGSPERSLGSPGYA